MVMEIGKNTRLTVSLGTLAAVLAFGWTGFRTADAYMDMITANAESVQILKAGLRLNTLDDQIGDLKRERRAIREKLRELDEQIESQEYDGYLGDIDEIEDELERLIEIRKCVVEMNAKVCE
jgi:hypothetical protein